MRAPVALFIPLCLLTITACGTTAELGPQLSVTPHSLVLDVEHPVQELWIGNEGSPGSVLEWSASGSSSLLRVSPARGEVPAGSGPQRVLVSIDLDSLRPGSVAQANLDLRSNGGEALLPLRVFATEGRSCFTGAAALLPADSVAGLGGDAFGGDPPAFVPGELLVAYELPAFAPLSAAAAISQNVREEHGLRLLGAASAAPLELVGAEDPIAAAQLLLEDPRVAWAHPNYYLRPQTLPDDPCLADQWTLRDFGVAEAWQQAGRHRVVVAVIDTGIDVDHEDLAPKALPGWDFWGSDADARPGAGNRHGTHVAGIALGQGGNGIGIAGVAWQSNVELLPVKVFSDDGSTGTTAQLVDAILWSAGYQVRGVPLNENPARVINISLGAGSGNIAALDWAVDMATRAGAVVIAAAGNNTSTTGAKGVQSPASARQAIAVGSVDQSLHRSRFSDWGATARTVDVMAPGGYGDSTCGLVRSTLPAHDYGCMGGTSMAAPFVAGVVALMLSDEPELTPARIRDRLAGASRRDQSYMNPREYGNGVLCAAAALSAGATCGW